MGAFTYPTFAVCVLIYNIVAALGSLLCGWLTPAPLPEQASESPAHYSLIIKEQKYDLLTRFPTARLQINDRDTSRMSLEELQSSIKEKKKHVAS